MLVGESVLTIFTPEILLLVVSILVASSFQYGNFQIFSKTKLDVSMLLSWTVITARNEVRAR